jgi:hypothetical protein
MSQMGQKAKYSLRADVFRSTPRSGHEAAAFGCPVCAKRRHWTFGLKRKRPPTGAAPPRAIVGGDNRLLIALDGVSAEGRILLANLKRGLILSAIVPSL